MSWNPSALPDLSGTTAIVTGANSGIGTHTARELAAHGAEVVLACRNVESAQKAAASINGRTRVERLDLSSQKSIAEFAARIEGPVDLLVNNAGVMTPPRYRETEDGHELQFGTNHLGHFALTGRLLPQLLAAADPRVVTVASIAHHRGDERVLEGNPASSYQPEKDYGQSKLANVLFMRELHRRAGGRLTSVGAHPGVSATNLVASTDGMGANPVVRRAAPFVMPILFQSAKAGANPSLYAAAFGEPGSYTGPQWLMESRGPIGRANLSRHARNDDLAARLWERSIELTGVEFAL